MQIEALPRDANLSEFIVFHHHLFRNDPAWVAPLDIEVRDRLSPAKNPFFEHAEVQLFIARKHGAVVGRCTAQLDREHLRVHGDGAGFFGFFDTIDDQDVASGLADAAAAWLRERGLKTMRGPVSLSLNEEAGTLVDGFEHPPVIMMPHSTRYQGKRIEGAGLSKVKDLLAWRVELGAPPDRASSADRADRASRADRALAAMDALPEVRFRSVRKRHIKREVKVLLEIFNDAWKHNWGFVPATEAEVAKIAADMKLIIDQELAFFVEIDRRPVAMCVALPNLNEATRDFGGKLSPVTIAKLLWRLKVRRLKSARLILLGIRTDLRGKKRYGALSTALYAEILRRAKARGYEWGECGWTLEDNQPINLGIRAMGGRVYKRYRIYERSL